MDPTILFVISIVITVTAVGGLAAYMKTLLKADKNGDGDKKDEILTKWLENMQSTLDLRLRNVQEQMDKTTSSLNSRVDESSKNMNVRLDKAAEVISNVQKELGSMSEIGRGMKDLQDFLKSPKLRGNIGEEILKDLLEQMIPAEHYKLQHMFKSGDIVDALLKVDEGYISVDSKFPMENFTAMMQGETADIRDSLRKLFIRDVKKHIDAINKKYILPAEGTVDFALMYIPSEAIYYEVVVNISELGKYSWEKRVLPVSPNVFYSYLKAILIGLEGKKVEERARDILAAIRGLKEDSSKFGESLRVMSKHLNNAKNTADEVNKSYEKLDNRIGTINSMKKLETVEPKLMEDLE